MLRVIRQKTHVDTRVVGGGIGRNRVEEVRGWRRRATPSDDELSTLRIELWRILLVERKQLVADEVVAGGEVRRDLARPFEFLSVG